MRRRVLRRIACDILARRKAPVAPADLAPAMLMRSVCQGAVKSTGVDCGRGAGGVPREEAGVDPGEFGHITQAVSVLGLDVVPILGTQVGVHVGGRGVAHVGAEEGSSCVAVSNACSFGEPGRRPEEIRVWVFGSMVKLRSALQSKPDIVMSEYETVDRLPRVGHTGALWALQRVALPLGSISGRGPGVRVSHSVWHDRSLR